MSACWETNNWKDSNMLTTVFRARAQHSTRPLMNTIQFASRSHRVKGTCPQTKLKNHEEPKIETREWTHRRHRLPNPPFFLDQRRVVSHKC